MTDKQFRGIFTDALKQNDRDAFVSEKHMTQAQNLDL